MDLPSCAQKHDWDLSPAEARRVQEILVNHVHENPLASPIHYIAGVDVSIQRKSGRAAIVVLEWPALRPVCRAAIQQDVTWPYVPGLLAFREIPLILRAWEQFRVQPDVIMVDGHGRAHPRRFGLACHLGVLLQIPTLGVAKRRYVGVHQEIGLEKGSRGALRDRVTGEVLGTVVRTRTNVSPVYVSTGHAITLDESVELTLKCAVKYRIPEPTRQAHLESRRWIV